MHMSVCVCVCVWSCMCINQSFIHFLGENKTLTDLPVTIHLQTFAYPWFLNFWVWYPKLTRKSSTFHSAYNILQAHAYQIMQLYHHPYSLDSQKVRLALEEKGIDYTSYHVNPVTGKNMDSSFFRMNPSGKLPVFKNGAHIIFNTIEIIQYVLILHSPFAVTLYIGKYRMCLEAFQNLNLIITFKFPYIEESIMLF